MIANAIDPPVKIPDMRQSDAAGLEEADPASYRDLTKEEVLDRIASGYKAARAGNRRPLQDLLDELDEMDD